MTRRPVLLAAAILVSLHSLPTGADEGRLLLPGTLPGCMNPTQTCLIDQPGRYVLTMDLIPAAGLTAVEIAADHVDLDLNGFRLRGRRFVPAVNINGFGNIAVRNGFIDSPAVIADPLWGVQAINGGLLILEDLTFNDGWMGVRLVSTGPFTLRRLELNGPAFAGIAVDDSGAVHAGVIEDCLVEDTQIGIGVNATESLSILNNQVRNAITGGIGVSSTSSCLIRGNSVSGAVIGGGITLSSVTACRVSENTISDAFSDALSLDSSSADNEIVGNVVTNGSNSGIAINGPRNTIRDNVTNSNINFGLLLNGNDNVYRGNTARGNGGTLACTGIPSPPDFCDNGTGNSSAGDNFMPGLL